MGCDTSTDVTDSGIPLGAGSGKSVISAPTTTGYVVTSTSKSGNTFVITKSATGTARTCTGDGGCNGGNW